MICVIQWTFYIFYFIDIHTVILAVNSFVVVLLVLVPWLLEVT